MSDLTGKPIAELRACLLPNITGEPYHGDIGPKLSALDELARRAEVQEAPDAARELLRRLDWWLANDLVCRLRETDELVWKQGVRWAVQRVHDQITSLLAEPASAPPRREPRFAFRDEAQEPSAVDLNAGHAAMRRLDEEVRRLYGGGQ